MTVEFVTVVVRAVACLAAVFAVSKEATCQTVDRAAQARKADVLLTSGMVIDGTGIPGRIADVALADGRIVAIGDLRGSINAERVIDCSGLVVCPGFIDLHNHSDRQIIRPETRAATNYVTQGCTTIVTGNCGSGPVNAGTFYADIQAHGAGVNVAHLLPQGSLRDEVIGTALRDATPAELARMQALADQAMKDGAWGMSSGLIYVPSSYASTEELTAIAAVVGKHGGLYASHIRNEGKELLEAVDEALRIGRDAKLPVHISHFKSSGRDAWGLVRRAAEQIEQARAAGQTVTADQYPYIASSTSLDATLLPSRVRSGGRQDLIRRLDSSDTGPEIRELVATAIAERADGEAIRIASYGPRPKWVGLSLRAIAEREGRPAIEIAYEIFRNGGAQIVNFSMDEDDVRHIMAIDWVATASDGRVYLPGADKPHPRSYGTFSRKIGHYALTEQTVSLPHAIRSATGLPAEILGLQDRGLLRDGFAADVVVFDPTTFRDAATFDEPHQYSTGLRFVFVNGVPTLTDGQPTGALAGVALRHASEKTASGQR